jgi:hypothetical protein
MEKGMYSVEVKYGKITKVYQERFDTPIQAIRFAQDKSTYPAFVHAVIKKVDNVDPTVYNIHIH